MIRVVAIQFNPAGKVYDFDAGPLPLQERDRVIVETERGLGVATVVAAPQERPRENCPQQLAKVKRQVTAEDEMTLAHHARREQEAYQFCIQRIQERGMDMKLVRVEQMFDGSKAVFYFTADGRVDFRELVKDLAHTFHTRIEMRQIGVRDEAKMVGGLGICGRELCCSSFLRSFQPVSVKMAKEQNLALNPTKISGQCGRLLCCLDYEYETYCDLRKSMPRCGKRACIADNEGIVEKVNILTGEMVIKTDDGKQVACHVNDLSTATGQSREKEKDRNEPGQQRRQNRPVPEMYQPAPREHKVLQETMTEPVIAERDIAAVEATASDKPKRRRRPRHGRNRTKNSNEPSTQE